MKSKTSTWFEIAKNDLDFARHILTSKGYAYYAAHFCHQAIEKILKAVISEGTNENPFPTHNFKVLCEQGNIKLPSELYNTLLSIAPHYLATKYPEDIAKLYKLYTVQYVDGLLDKTERLFEWLRNHYLK